MAKRNSQLRQRSLEWGIVLVVVIVVVGYFGREYRALQAQAELAAVQTTLGSLRTSLVIDHLQRNVQASQGLAQKPLQPNPFLVARTTGNYAGEMSMSRIVDIAPGSWVFDRDCVCIGYRPINPQGLEPDTEPRTLWYKIDAPSGVLEIRALADYRWQGLRVN